eukprot:CAMPEP_0179420064 /NCGR_PEP_ID=MMETSP0799-20121207/8960_1 /TAXON_ID=46947 /ORGANISM="Geminigera cryophila, Strain CCMP2564" /LENGTH=114 /DNA_ID=CAMNT_0021193633 /DNA_START=1785 /DNA_END=2129 /DNA_ORIENTATION=-
MMECCKCLSVFLYFLERLPCLLVLYVTLLHAMDGAAQQQLAEDAEDDPEHKKQTVRQYKVGAVDTNEQSVVQIVDGYTHEEGPWRHTHQVLLVPDDCPAHPYPRKGEEPPDHRV